MSKNSIRKDKTCLNCKHVVENIFCPNCGQKNEDTRKTFHHLFLHFFEDLTHYENAFWKTIRYLIFNPALLTKEYLSGKRLSYLAPVRLYIFISFVTFFTLSLFPKEDSHVINVKEKKEKEETKANIKKSLAEITHDKESNDKKRTASKEELKIIALQKEGRLTQKEADTLINYIKKSKEKENRAFYFGSKKYKSLKQLDSIQKYGKSSEKLPSIRYWFTKKTIEIGKKYSIDELNEKFKESFFHNFPKILFIYMPIFALILWLFHNKKRWYYFDHGIFTLHYFSFLLLLSLIYTIISALLAFVFGENNKYVDFILGFLLFTQFIWVIIYFFKAHHRFYEETRTISFIKSLLMYFINMFFISFILLIFVVFTFINIH
ncbi:MAG: DUF3667 domain-containing protein [Flavobacterium sp.]|uniref:DUF3667 domain-containing protein n=1 Tax=Flavobacterium sp. TaxID=239 RepID=UPI0032646F21